MDSAPRPDPPIHSMSDGDREVARAVLTAAWSRLSPPATEPPEPAGPPSPASEPKREPSSTGSAGSAPAAPGKPRSPSGGPILAAVRAAATALPEFRVDVDAA